MTDKISQTNEMTAGQMMFNARTAGRRKRELQTIARQLCVKEEFLDALERGEYKRIPELVHVFGFARNYAIELGLNPDEIIKKIKSELNIKPEFEEQDDEESGKSVDFSGAMAGLTKKLTMNWKIIAGAIAAIFIIIISVKIVAFVRTSMDTTDSDQVSEQMGPQIKFTIPVKEYFGTENRADARVVLQAQAETWLKVENTKGETLFSRVLVAGDVYYAPTENARATLGNAGGVDVWVNGDLIPKLGAANTRKSGINLTPEGLIAKPAAVPQEQQNVSVE